MREVGQALFKKSEFLTEGCWRSKLYVYREHRLCMYDGGGGCQDKRKKRIKIKDINNKIIWPENIYQKNKAWTGYCVDTCVLWKLVLLLGTVVITSASMSQCLVASRKNDVLNAKLKMNRNVQCTVNLWCLSCASCVTALLQLGSEHGTHRHSPFWHIRWCLIRACRETPRLGFYTVVYCHLCTFKATQLFCFYRSSS